MTQIAVLTDVHANLPALQAVLAHLDKVGVDAIYHTGDVIGIGPYPAECLDLLLAQPRIRFTLGNHDDYFVHGLPTPLPDWMSSGEVAHQYWTHRQLEDVLRIVMAQWPLQIQENIEGVQMTFTHYGLQPGTRAFRPVNRQPEPAVLDEIFRNPNAELLFFGHDHAPRDVIGAARYLNPGSLGCSREAVAGAITVSCRQGTYTLKKHAVPYDDEPLFRAYVKRQVPERQFICRVFHGNRRPSASR